MCPHKFKKVECVEFEIELNDDIYYINLCEDCLRDELGVFH